MHALVDSDTADTPGVRAQLERLQKVLERGDPLLDRRLVQLVAVTYEPSGPPMLPLPEVA
jgi:hypothetical protein